MLRRLIKCRRTAPLVVLFGLLRLLFPGAGVAAPRTLDIYFVDTEGGAATLVVTPAGESLLVDSGNPGERDSGRIAHVAREVAGLSQIDYYITTHWHRDHFGGTLALAQLIPIRRFYDHGIPDTLPPDVDPQLIAAYRRTSQGKTMTLKAGDTIKLKAERGSASLRLRVLAAGGMVLGDASAEPQVRPCGANFQPAAEDPTDNARSIVLLLSFGRFKFFDGGDLTWNVEHRLVCPKNIPGAVDVFQVNHHGLDLSNNPALVSALAPRVAVINNGPRKGGAARTFATLKGVPSIQAIFQLHRNLLTTDRDNAPAAFVANTEESCRGDFIKLSVEPGGKSYSVRIPGKALTYSYRTR